jgi:hypothetical protein
MNGKEREHWGKIRKDKGRWGNIDRKNHRELQTRHRVGTRS